MDAADLNCRQFVESVTDYREAALPSEARAQCDEHVERCGPCSKYLEQMRRTVLALGRLIDETVDGAARDELIRRFRDWQGTAGTA